MVRELPRDPFEVLRLGRTAQGTLAVLSRAPPSFLTSMSRDAGIRYDTNHELVYTDFIAALFYSSKSAERDICSQIFVLSLEHRYERKQKC